MIFIIIIVFDEYFHHLSEFLLKDVLQVSEAFPLCMCRRLSPLHVSEAFSFTCVGGFLQGIQKDSPRSSANGCGQVAPTDMSMGLVQVVPSAIPLVWPVST